MTKTYETPQTIRDYWDAVTIRGIARRLFVPSMFGKVKPTKKDRERAEGWARGVLADPGSKAAALAAWEKYAGGDE